MPDGHGYTTYFIPEEETDKYATVLSGFGLGYTTKASGGRDAPTSSATPWKSWPSKPACLTKP